MGFGQEHVHAALKSSGTSGNPRNVLLARAEGQGGSTSGTGLRTGFRVDWCPRILVR